MKLASQLLHSIQYYVVMTSTTSINLTDPTYIESIFMRLWLHHAAAAAASHWKIIKLIRSMIFHCIYIDTSCNRILQVVTDDYSGKDKYTSSTM